MKKDYFIAMMAGMEPGELLQFMERTDFDELVQVDLRTDQARLLFHVKGKYDAAAMDERFSALFAYGEEHVVHPEDRAAHRALLDPSTLAERLRAADPPGILAGEMRFLTTAGDYRWVRQVLVSGERYGLPEGVVNSYFYDIDTQKQREAGRQVVWDRGNCQYQADELTGLMPEAEFFDRARRLAAREGELPWCLIDLSIEHFKLFQEWNGMEKARLLLAGIGRVLRRAARETDGAACYRGQDEFCLMIPYDSRRVEALYEEARHVVVEMSSAVGFLPVMGVCVLEGTDSQVLDAFNHAALAAEDARADAARHLQVYNAATHERNTAEFRLLTEFQHALENGEISFYLQPQCRVSNARMVGAESLARWRRANGEFVSPAVFVPILEKYGIVTNLDRFIWEAVCRWLRSLIDLGGQPVPVSVNVSQIDIFTINVPEYIGGLLRKYSLTPELLKIEITESAYVEDTSIVRQTVQKLREMGLQVLMDDFGSGASSLNMLRSINVDVIKLDAQFLHIGGQADEERKGISILESVISMAKTLSTPIIVEGVETLEQVRFLSDLGCRYMQGFYFYRPMPAQEFELLLRDERNMDRAGIVFKANRELHAREFMDESVYSDAMLNNILGPVAFYRWKGDSVDIIRYNQQFFQTVGIEAGQMNERVHNIQQFFYPGDLPKFYQMLEYAVQHHALGGSGVFRIYRPNGVIMWMSMQVYYMDEDADGKRFYGSSRDVTELQYINMDLPGAYYRCTARDGFQFLYISQNYQTMTGYTEAEIRAQFDGKLINMVHPEDVPLLREEGEQVLNGVLHKFSPYRLRRKQGDYIYVADQSVLTDRFGQPCWQSVVIDVSEVMRLRNQMRLLASVSKSSVVFMRRQGERFAYEIVLHGLGKPLGISAEDFRQMLESGQLCAWIDLPEEEKRRRLRQGPSPKSMNGDYTVRFPGREPVRLAIRLERMPGQEQSEDGIIAFRLAE